MLVLCLAVGERLSQLSTAHRPTRSGGGWGGRGRGGVGEGGRGSRVREGFRLCGVFPCSIRGLRGCRSVYVFVCGFRVPRMCSVRHVFACDVYLVTAHVFSASGRFVCVCARILYCSVVVTVSLVMCSTPMKKPDKSTITLPSVVQSVVASSVW